MEFDIRIGTLLDTSQAEEQLKDFINKYSGDNDFKINLKISGDEKLEGIEKSLTNIKNLAKSIGNIKMDFDGGGVNVDTAFNKTIEKAKKEIRDFSKEFGSQTSNGVEDSVKNISKNLDKEIDNTKKKIESMVKNLENLKLNPFADSNEIDKMITSLKDMGSMSFEDFPNLKLMAVKEEIESITKAYSDLQATAKNKQLDDIFQTTKVEPLRQQILALKEVMDFKNLDTSGLDKLLDDLKKTSELKDLKQAKAVLNDVKAGFANIQGTTDISKSVKTYETAIQELLKYRRELEEKVRMEIDTSKIQQAEADIKRIDEAIDRLKMNADESIVKNLFDMSELKNMENMEKASKTLQNNLGKLGDVFDKLKVKTTQLSNLEFVDIASLAAVQSYIKDIEKSIKSLDFDNLKATEIEKVKEDLETLEACINSVANASKKMELEVNFANDLQKAEQQLNGLESALIKLGQSTKEIDDLKQKLSSIGNLAKTDLGMATTKLKSFTEEFKGIKDFGDISGGMSQFTKYVNDIVASTKKLLTIKDVEFADTIKQEVNQTISALHQLMKTFDGSEKEFASDFYVKALDGLSEKFGQEINKIQTQADKLTTSLYKIGKDVNFDNSIQADELANDLKQATEHVEKLQNALRQASGSNIDIDGFEQLKNELKEAEQYVEKLQKKRIELDCNQAIQKMEQLKNSIKDVDEVLERIGGADAINRIVSDFENGVITFDKATASIKKFDDTLDKIGDGSIKLSKSFDGIDEAGSKIEGVFSSIKDAFSTFTLGALIEEGIENLAYSITETITGLDAAMTELRRVAPEGLNFSGENYKQIANDAREVALSVGQSVEDVITGMSTALQAGATSMAQATEIARTSALLQNVSDMGADEASQAISSMVNQYYSMDTALSKVQDRIKGAPQDYNNLTNAIDMVNYAGNNWAISSQGVTEALQNGGAVLSNYGVTLSDSIAMISSANESLQDPSRIGNGLRSLAVNFAGIKANAKEGTLELNKSAKTLKEVAGIDIFTDKSKTSVKDMMTLMDEINEKWDTLTDKEQKGLSEALAGKTQAAVFQSLMSGWDRVRQFQQEYKDGFMVGSAEKENAAYLDSIAGKWNTLKENMKALLTNNVSVDFIKGLLDGVNNVVVAIDKIISKLGTIGTGGALIGLMTFIKSMSNFGKILKGDMGTFTGFGKVISTMFTGFKTGGITGSITALVAGFKGLSVSAGLAKVGMIALNAALSAIGWGLLIAGISWAIKKWNEYAHATENAVKAAQEGQEEARQQISSLNTQKSSLSAIAEEYDKLTSKTRLTADEHERLKELREQIASIAPELVSGYDENGDPIIKLNGSLQDYIKDLDVAIEKQERLFREKQAEEADAYLKDNNKKYKNAYNEVINMTGEKTALGIGTDYSSEISKAKNLMGVYYSESEKTAKGLAEARKKWRADEEKSEKKLLSNLSEQRAEYNKEDSAIQAKYINEFMQNANKNLTTNNKNQFSGFMETLGWGTLGEEDADIFGRGLQRLSEKTAYTADGLDSVNKKATQLAQEGFAEDGRINKYGKALQQIATDSGKFDLTSWNGYLEEVNKRYEEGAMSSEEYRYSIGLMAQTMSDICDVPYDVVLETLMQTADIEQVFESASSGLNNFLQAYGKTTTDVRNNNSLAVALAEQYESVVEFGKELEDRIIKGTVTVDWLIEQKEDLPQQMGEIIDAVTNNGTREPTEVEQLLLLNLQAEIQDNGKFTDETLKIIENLLDDNFVIDKEIEIAGMKLSVEQAEEFRRILKESGITLEELSEGTAEVKFEEAIKEAEQLKKAISEIKDVDLRKAFKAPDVSSFIDTEKELNMMLQTVKQFKDKETKLNFIAETAEFFNGKNSVEEAINSMPDVIKLKYNIGVEGDERLKGIQEKIKKLPQKIQTGIWAETYGLEQVDTLLDLVKKFGKKKAVALLELEGADKVLAEANTMKELLQGLEELLVEPTVDPKIRDEMLPIIQQALKELDKTKVEPTVDANTEPAKQKNEEVKQQKEELKENVEYNVNQNNTNVKEKSEEVKKEKKEVEKPVETKATMDGSQAKQELKEVNEGKKEVEKPAKVNTTIKVLGREEIHATINEKGQLEVDGEAKTQIVIDNLGALPVAINEKGQLEVNGVAQTHIQIKDGEDLVITKNAKGELEVNGQAITNVEVKGMEKPKEAKEVIEEIPEEKESRVTVKFDVNDAIDSVLSRLGLSKKKETIEITVKAIDEASSVLDKVNGFEGKTITFTITANGGTEATQQISTIANTTISNKTFTITCTGGDTVSNQIKTISSTTIANKSFTVTANTGTVSTQLNSIATRTIPNKTFQVTCNDSASAKISAITGRQIPTKKFSVICNDQATSKLSAVQNKKVQNKKFTINCTDQASAKISKVQGKKINNKSFTVSCTDNASGKLSGIISKLGAIRSKSVTVTARYATSGTKPAGLSTSQPQVVEMGTAIPVTMNLDNSSIASTMSMARTTASAVNEAMVSTQAKNYTDTILASKYWANQSLDHDLDLLKDYTAQLDRVASKLDIVGAKIDSAFGSAKAKYLKDQIKLLEQQQAMLKLQQKDAKTLAGNYKSLLKEQGFKVDSNGAVTNATDKILALEHALEKAQKAQDAYTGKSESKQKSLENATKKAQDKLNKAKETLDQYYDMSNKVAETEAEWREIANAIKEAKNEIYEANKEQEQFYKKAKTTELEHSYDRLSDQLDIVQAKMDLEKNATNKELLEEELSLLKQMQRENEKVEASYRNQTHYYKNYLSKKGFAFDEEGNITNGAKALDKNKASDEIESIQDAYESYMELMRDTIPDLEKEWWELEKAEEEAKNRIKEAEEEAKKLAEEMKELEKIKILDNIDEDIRVAEKLESKMEELNDMLELADGDDKKIDLMNKQLDLLDEQMSQQKHITSELKGQEKYLQGVLSEEGFKFNSNGDISNLDSLLNSAQTQEEYDKLKEKAEEYQDIQDQLLDSENQWRDYQIEIKETQQEIENLKYEMEKLKDEANLQEFTNDLEIINNELEKLQAIGELGGVNSLENLNQQLNVIKQQQSATEDLLEYQKSQVRDMKNELSDYGFKINDDGTIDNTANQLDYLKSTLSDDEFERISETLEEYFDVALSEIPDLETQLIEYQRDYQDILEQKLEATEKIEQEITKILEKQIEERIDAIEKERDAQVDSLNKQKDAYNKWRDEVNYEDDYNEQLEKVQELQAQLEIAKRDDSLSGQKRVAELMEQLKEEQGTLEDLVQDKIDQNINDMFDNQIENVENNADKQIEDLENVFTETKIAEMVAEAIQTGLFTDIEGNVTSLDTALMNMANNSVEYMGVMGQSLKTELLDNLNIALDTMSQINQINKELGQGYNMDILNPIVNTSPISIDTSSIKTQPIQENSISLGDMVINVQGNVTDDSIDDIRIALEQQRTQIINEIMANVK